MHVDDAFVAAVMQRSRDNQPPRDAGEEEVFRCAIEIVLAVAAERGLVVPDDAPKAWAIKYGVEVQQVCLIDDKDTVGCYCYEGETVVRVAIVETKEDGK